MEEIEVGEYIRTKSGVIIKADFIDFERLTISQRGLGYDFEDAEEMEDFIKNEIAKHSKNIIDLIEAGDYVNGYRVYHIAGHYVTVESLEKYDLCFEEQDIKTILTHEQFKSMKYKIEAEE